MYNVMVQMIITQTGCLGDIAELKKHVSFRSRLELYFIRWKKRNAIMNVCIASCLLNRKPTVKKNVISV